MSKKDEVKVVQCCVKNCQKEIPIENAITFKDKYFCGICGVAFVRSSLNI